MKKQKERSRTQARNTHVGRLLFELTRDFESKSLARLHALGHHTLTQAQKQVVVHLPLDGARITDLAARAGVTKQTMMRLVDGLEMQGYVRRQADPADSRAKWVLLTSRGHALLNDGLACVDAIQHEYRAALGAGKFDALHQQLQALAATLGVRGPDN